MKKWMKQILIMLLVFTFVFRNIEIDGADY